MTGPARPPAKPTARRITLRTAELAALTVAGWCVMNFTHEVGHLTGGWLGGGTLRDVWLGPWPPPHSRFHPDPRPLLTLWAGPVLGCVVPVLLAACVPRRWARGRARAWFLADFCLLANGSSLAVSWVAGDRLLDAPRLLAEGVSPWRLGLFTAAVAGVGYVRFRADCRAVWERPAA